MIGGAVRGLIQTATPPLPTTEQQHTHTHMHCKEEDHDLIGLGGLCWVCVLSETTLCVKSVFAYTLLRDCMPMCVCACVIQPNEAEKSKKIYRQLNSIKTFTQPFL